MKKNLLTRGFLASVFLASCAISAQAQIEKADNTDDLSTGSSWVGDVAPGSGDIAQWDSTVSSGSASETYGSNVSWAGISILDPAAPIDIESATNSVDGVSIGASGITLSGQSLSINTGATGTADGNAVDLTANQSWSVASGLTLAMGRVNYNGESVTLSGLGTVSATSTSGGGSVTLTGGVTYEDGDTNVSPAVNFNGGTFVGHDTPYSQIYLTVSSLNGTNYIGASSDSLHISGAISGNGSLEAENAEGLYLDAGFDSGNTFTGTIIYNNGGNNGRADSGGENATFQINSGSSVLVSNDAGMDTTVNFGALTGAGEIFANEYDGGISTVVCTVEVGNANQNSTYSGDFLDQGQYEDHGKLALDKVGTGKLILNSTATDNSATAYTGTTTVSAGILQNDIAGPSMTSTTGITVAHGATLQGTSTIGSLQNSQYGTNMLLTPASIDVHGTIIGGDNNGVSAGTMGIAGNLTLEADSTLYANAFANGNSDKLTLSSGVTATLDSGTLVLDLHYAAVDGDSFVVIDPTAGGTISGTFGTVEVEDNGTMTDDVATFNDTTGAVTIDSTSAVPEPGVNALLFVGIGFLAFFQISRRRRMNS